MKKMCSLVLVLFLFTLVVSAQYKRGSIYIDGNVTYTNDLTNNNVTLVSVPAEVKSRNLVVSPNIGYFLADNFVLGVGLNYRSIFGSSSGLNYVDNEKDSVTYMSDIRSTKWNEFAPVIFAKYIFPITDKLSLSLKAKFSHGLVKDEISINSTTKVEDLQGNLLVQRPSNFATEKPSGQTNRFNLSPEVQYLITNKIGLQVNFTGFSYNSVPVITPTYEAIDNGNGYNIKIYSGTQKTTTFSINPSSWSFGLFVLLGGQSSK